MKVVFDDGGRSAAGFRGTVGDCCARSIAIVAQLPYVEVYGMLSAVNARTPKSKRRKANTVGRFTAATGIYVKSVIFKRYMAFLGFVWTPTMFIGSGCKVHLREGEIPPQGRLVVALSRHYTAVVDGVIHDTHDPSRRGTRCVYGYWRIP